MIFNEASAKKILGFEASDAQLLEMITSDANLDKSDIALGVLIERHERAIRDAIFFAGARTSEDGEEAYGEFIVKIMTEWNKNRLTSIRDREEPVKYLRQVARNAAIDYLRGKRDLSEEGEYLLPSPSLDPGKIIIKKEYLKEAKRCVKWYLSKDYVPVFKLYLKGYKYSEIGEELNIPLGTVNSRLGKIFNILRDHKLIEDDGDSY